MAAFAIYAFRVFLPSFAMWSPRARIASTRTASVGAAASARTDAIRIALTRQMGENGKLHIALSSALRRSGVPKDATDIFELPCIEHTIEADYELLKCRLAALAASGGQDDGAGARPLGAILLTSPESARVFVAAWRETGAPAQTIPVVCVGSGTSAVVASAGLSVEFEPSLADASSLAAELPQRFGPRVLYAASAVAPNILQDRLAERGFEVNRLDTYTTRPVLDHDSETLAMMAGTDIVTLGSPSAVRTWARLAGHRAIAVCIGRTSQQAAEIEGFARAVAPSQPGVEGWAKSTAELVCEQLGLR